MDPQAAYLLLVACVLCTAIGVIQACTHIALSTRADDRAFREAELWSHAYAIKRGAHRNG